MPNVNILEASNNLMKAAAMKRDEKRQLLAEMDSNSRDIDKKLDTKQNEYRIMANRATDSSKTKAENAQAAVLARKFKGDIDDLKKYESQQTSELKQAADRLVQEALNLENEAKNLQSQA